MPQTIEMLPPPLELVMMHEDICNKLPHFSIMIVAFGPHDKTAEIAKAKLTVLLNDMEMFPMFLQVLILQYERMTAQSDKIEKLDS